VKKRETGILRTFPHKKLKNFLDEFFVCFFPGCKVVEKEIDEFWRKSVYFLSSSASLLFVHVFVLFCSII